ncbi:hypothetical protein [Streptomyces hirsutus]|uniref:hypothetical protein n=1 Tax=Streptomyces hirsutus TaxID=35620 RepID=UPI00365A105B
MSAPTTIEVTPARTLVDGSFFTRLSSRIATANSLDTELADRIADQTLAYLAACAQKQPGTGTLSPSPTVDLGLHEFLQYTEPYDRFFEDHGWEKVHHHPFDRPERTYESAAVILERTTRAIEAAGYRLDAELWAASSVSCGGDDSDGQPGDPLPCGDHG